MPRHIPHTVLQLCVGISDLQKGKCEFVRLRSWAIVDNGDWVGCHFVPGCRALAKQKCSSQKSAQP